MAKVRTFYGHEGVVRPLGLIRKVEDEKPEEATDSLESLAVAGAPEELVAQVAEEAAQEDEIEVDLTETDEEVHEDHEGDSHECPECGASFSTARGLGAHKRIHSKEG